MIKKYMNEYYVVKGTTFHELDTTEKFRLSELQLGEKVSNLAHIYSKMILLPYKHRNQFEFNIFKVMLEAHGLDVDYFELVMVYMEANTIDMYDAHFGLLRLWINI